MPMQILPTSPPPKNPRECGTCTACCTYFKIAILDKPALDPCSLLVDGCTREWTGPTDKNCTRYDTRPGVCSGYTCMWAHGHGAEEDRPDRSGVMVDTATPVKNALRAVIIRNGADETPEGSAAVRRISRDSDQPVFVLSYGEKGIMYVVGSGAR